MSEFAGANALAPLGEGMKDAENAPTWGSWFPVLGSWLRGHELTGSDAAILTVSGLFTVARFPMSALPQVGQLALLVLLGIPGLLVVVRRVGWGDEVAALLGVFVISAAVSASLSPGVRYSLIGDVMAATPSVLVIALVAGWWGAGTALSASARQLLPWVLLAGLAVNALVGMLQIALDITAGPLGTSTGRASGLMHNPIRYAGLAAGLACWTLHRAATVGGRRHLPLVVAVCFAAGLSGSRGAAAIVLAVGAAMVVIRRSKSALSALVAAVAGFAAAAGYVALLSSRHLVARLEDGDGPGERAAIWRFGLDAWTERPVFGWGPSHFGTAVWPRYSLEFIRDAGAAEGPHLWTDPHNIAVLALVTTGVVGTALVVCFVVAALRRGVDAGLGLIVLGMVSMWALQPPRTTLSIAMLVFGAALVPGRFGGRVRVGRHPVWLAAGLVGVAVGVMAAAYLVAGDVRLHSALNGDDPLAVERAAGWFHDDPVVAQHVAQWMAAAQARGSTEPESAVVWARRAATQDPHNPAAWTRLAEMQLIADDFAGSRSSLDQALALQPWNPTAHRLMLRYAAETGQQDLASDTTAVLCSLGAIECTSGERR